MTQELVLVALLTGLLGLVWIMTMSILFDDRTRSKTRPTETAQPLRDGPADQVIPLEHLIKKGRNNVA